MHTPRFLLFALFSLLFAVTARAQFEIKVDSTNVLDPRRAGASASISAGVVNSITVRGGGAGYTAAPSVVIAAPPSGTTATAIASISGGVVTAITITNGGSNYVSAPAIYIAPPPILGSGVTTGPQHAGMSNTTTAAAAGRSTSVANVSPAIASYYPNSIAKTYSTPASPTLSTWIAPGTATVASITLVAATVGDDFAAGVPLYFMGDEITRPTLDWNNIPVSASYWRAEPVKAGEIFASAYLDNLSPISAQPIIALGSVNVLTSSTGSSTVTVATAPATLTAGATLLGQRVNMVSGTTITLAGNANQAISTSTAVSYTEYQPFYYSPHAGRVFASQPGRVTITWVSAAPDTSKAGESTPTYKFRRETFAVSSGSRQPARTIFWTEAQKGFSGPLVTIPPGRITLINPIFNSFVPGMTTEYVPVGSNTNPNTSGAAEPRTVWYDKLGNTASLHAYNVEGRLFIEYLGAQVSGNVGVHEFLGADILDIKRVADVTTVQTDLGEKLRPRQGDAQTGDDQLIPKVEVNLSQTGSQLYGSYLRADGITDYYAERENLDPDRVTLYWLETKDASIHFLTAPASPGIAIEWPKYKRNYTHVWPSSIGSYQPVNVMQNGSSVGTGPQFAASNLPSIIFQDDPANAEAVIDANTQRLLVDFTESSDKTNRTLLKFDSTVGPWYVRMFIQSQEQLGTPEVPDPDGAGPLIGTPAVFTLNDLNADGIADWSPGALVNATGGTTQAIVGQRIERPSSAYEVGGYVAEGRCYSATAYIDPFTSGVAAAASGGIIPVNALSTDRHLTIWWFKKVAAPNSNFADFYVPAIAANYQVSYPSAAQELIIASGNGIENPGLTSEQAAGSLYVQNNPGLVGYNPNEEHALMLNGNVYALRDDLNAATSSEPFVLIQYTEPLTSRPIMRVVKVLRSNATYPLSFDKIAGTPLQPPMPLTLLPLPLKPDTSVRNAEVAISADTAAGSGAPTSYNRFTFADRKGQTWIYRGPHNGGEPSFGMQFYYYLREGFNFPGLTTQPAVGSIQPFIAAGPQQNVNGGDAITLTYRPKWPDDDSLPIADQRTLGELSSGQTLTLAKAGLPQVRGQTSAQVLYQQSIANSGVNSKAVVLHDATRQKTLLFGSNGLPSKLPPSVAITPYAGRSYFQGLPPHLQSRFYFDPNLGSNGGLVLTGEFVDVPVGEDYLNLNALSLADINTLNALCPDADVINKPIWTAAINGLSTQLQTWRRYTTAKATTAIGKGARVAVDWNNPMINGRSEVSVIEIRVTDAGFGYNSAPLIPLPGKAKAEATLTGSAVSAVTVLDPFTREPFNGSYPPQPTVPAPANKGQVIYLKLEHGGSGYTSPPDIVIDPPGNGGTRATATCTIAQGAVASITITDPGSGYTESPNITITPPAVPFAVDASLNRNIALGTLSEITDPDTAVDSYALSSTGAGTGYVTLVFGNGKVFTDAADPVNMQIIKVSPTLYQGDVKALLSSNPLDEKVTLRHSGDYGARPENFEFEWRYGFPTSGGTFPAGDPATDPDWITPNGTQGSSVLVGGSPTATISTPAVLMGDTWFTMRYKKAGTSTYSDWVAPVLVEGWIKRVLGKITPFNQRMDNLYNNSVNTDVSLLTQAGHRWEGDIALNLDNVNDAGLIEIYETLLNRGKAFTIGSGTDLNSSNQALLLAAGYLSDLYTILGNEAYADAANPTISIDDQTTVTEVNTSRFSFEGQVASALDEELALLRGRDDFGLTNIGLAPAYNRLFWNYTRGINSGEVLYAVNYNIKEKSGSSADGKVDAADALRMFPQGHGDAYGHYLTALTGYYKLLTHPDFTWTPTAEAVTVLGQSVLVDYKDERKFAAAAGNVARTAQQICALVQRQSYNDDPAAGWSHLQDGKVNSQTNSTRYQGLDETTSRAAQGSFFHWITGNAMLVDHDTNPAHTGVQVVDRSTVPELGELASAGQSFQNTMDLANAHLNPLGLSPGAIAFDISPAEHKAGNSHYEQINARALRAVLNAKGSFDQAAKMTRLLRNQENQIIDRQEAIEDQESAYVNQLIDIYGAPYAGDIGPGKTYAQGYAGPDLLRWYIIDRPTDLVDTLKTVKVTIRVPTQIRGFSGNGIADITSSYTNSDTVQKTFAVTPSQFAQFSQVIEATGSLGQRPQTGTLQQALLDSYLARIALLEAAQELQVAQDRFASKTTLFQGLVKSHSDQIELGKSRNVTLSTMTTSADVLKKVATAASLSAFKVKEFIEAGVEGFPKVVGLANDPTSGLRAASKFAGISTTTLLATAAASASAGSIALENLAVGLSRDVLIQLEEAGFKQEQLQVAYEFQRDYYDLITHHHRIATLMAAYQIAEQKVANLEANGQRLLTERETFRKRAAAIITGYRTKDLTFRTFRNEALEQYRTLFDLASRYTFLAAKSYDYETGLLGTAAGRTVINKIVASRSLGDLTGGVPQATVSTLGDAGLAGTMAQLNADFSVAEGRLGINNPDQYGTLFSLRHELYRLLDDPGQTDDDQAWQQTLEQSIVPNLMADPDVVRYCNNIKKPDGTNVPGILIPFSSIINHTDNFFGLPGAAGDHAYSPSSYSTKISSVGIVLPGYIGMDPYAIGTPSAGSPNTTDPNALRATPYVYLIPCGTDFMLAPPLGDTNTIRAWNVHDQALPLPYNLGASAFSTTQFFTANGTLSEQPWILRKHQAFRPVNDPAFFYSSIPSEFTNSRLIGRSVWNSQWKIVIPAYTLLSNEQDGLTRFVRSVKDIKLFLRTYSHSGN